MTLTLARPVADAATRIAGEAGQFARRGLDAVVDRGYDLRDRTLRASDNAVWYIKDEPVKAVALAALAGAVLASCAWLYVRSQSKRRIF